MRTLILTVALLAMVMSVASAEDLGTFGAYNYVDGSTLHINRDDIGGGIWRWTYELFNDNANDITLTYFSVGLLADDTPTGLNAGHFFGYQSDKWDGSAWQAMASTKTEYPSFASWNGFALADGEKARFVFDTDFQYVGVANHQGRDTVYSPDWQLRPTPAPVVPEATTMILGAMGLSTVAGFRRFRVK